MAVINEYVNTQDGAQVNEARGGAVIALSGAFEVATGDSDGSKYRLAKLNKNLTPIQIDINCDSITGATDYDLGLYETLENGGAVKDKDCYLDGANISAGKAMGSEQNGLATLPVDEIGDQVWEHADVSDENDAQEEYDLVLTANTVGTGAGTVAWRALFAKTA